MTGATGQQPHNGAEWRVTVPDGEASVTADTVQGHRRWPVVSWMAVLRDTVVGFAKVVWKIGADDPRKVVHGLKVALALTLCSVFYYVRPLYDCVGGTAMWAILTAVVVFEYTVGGCLYKGFNRAMATVTGGALALGVHWIASKSGEQLEPVILSGSVFVLAAAATFSRFISALKSRFDYGLTIFILTYSLVAVSGYRVDSLVSMAQQRLTTISMGAFICLAVCVLVFPVWAGQELHLLVARNMEKLAAAVEGCVDDYFVTGADPNTDAATGTRPLSAKSQGYKFVLNSKASEDSLVNLARWEPRHGKFGFRHPYGQYQKVGAAMRGCAYCVDALGACASSEAQTTEHVKKHLGGICTTLGKHCAAVLMEASSSIGSMTRSWRLDIAVADMNIAAQALRTELRSLAAKLQEESPEIMQHEQITMSPPPPLFEALPLFTAASLLLEICGRTEGVVGTVDSLATMARFKKSSDEKGMDTEASAQQSMMKVLFLRKRSTKKWSAGESKVSPKQPVDFTNHAPNLKNHPMEFANHTPVAFSPKNRSIDFANHALVVRSPGNRPLDFVSHASVAPSPKNRSMDFINHAPSPKKSYLEFANHSPVAPNPRNHSMDFANHPFSPKNRSMEFGNHALVVPSPKNHSMDFTSHVPSPRNRSVLVMA